MITARVPGRHPVTWPAVLAPAVRAAAVLAGMIPSVAAQVERFGRPCSSVRGTVPRVTTDRVAVAGSTLTMRVDTDAPGARVFLALGTSNRTWRGQALPLDLGRSGLAGCQLLVRPDVLILRTADRSGRVRVQLPITGAAIGQHGYVQAFADDRDRSEWGLSDGLAVNVVAPIPDHTVVQLPDTQYYTISNTLFPHFVAQTRWILNHRASRGIAFVTHVGDVVESGAQGPARNVAQWDRAERALSLLDGDLQTQKDGVVPYGVCIGNHDYDVLNVQTSATRFLDYFGPWRYTGRSWYLGASANGLNHAQLFFVGGVPYLHLAIQWRVPDAAISWAQSQLVARPGVPTMITTHEHLRPGIQPIRAVQGHTPESGGSNSGEDAFRKLVEPFPQVFLVTCGHKKGEGTLTSRSILGRTVHEMLANYQFDPNGGNGWFRTMQFRPGLRRIEVRTISPTYVRGTTLGPDYSSNASSNFGLAYDPAEHRGFLGSHRVLRYRQGQDLGHGVYWGARDSTVSAARPNTAFGSSSMLVCDRPTRTQGLLRFDGLVGAESSRIPRHTRIARAILTLTTEGPLAASYTGGKLFPLTIDWTEDVTHRSLVDGVRVGRDTLPDADVDTAGWVDGTGTRSFDVTERVQAWVDGHLNNHGWALIANGDDLWAIRSADWGTITERPMLTVFY